MSDNYNMEAAALMNIANSYKTPQSLGKSFSRICEKLPKSPLKKQAVIKALAGIIHSEKQPSNNVTSIETAQFVKNFFAHPDIVYTMPGMKVEITIW